MYKLSQLNNQRNTKPRTAYGSTLIRLKLAKLGADGVRLGKQVYR